MIEVTADKLDQIGEEIDQIASRNETPEDPSGIAGTLNELGYELTAETLIETAGYIDAPLLGAGIVFGLMLAREAATVGEVPQEVSE